MHGDPLPEPQDIILRLMEAADEVDEIPTEQIALLLRTAAVDIATLRSYIREQRIEAIAVLPPEGRG